MTESEWLVSGQPMALLESLGRKASVRKRRLFAVACCRRVAHLLTLVEYRNALDLAEEFADCPTHQRRFATASKTLWEARHGSELTPAEHRAADAVEYCFSDRRYPFEQWIAQHVFEALAFWAEEGLLRSINIFQRSQQRANTLSEESRQQADLVREIFGNPFRSRSTIVDWSGRNDAIGRRVASSIYDEKAYDQLPILADALEDAGCDRDDLLAHLRSDTHHVRGCWALDVVLGRT